MVHEGPGSGHINPVLAAAPKDGSRDGVELRRPSRSHVLLHRTSKSVGRPFECREDRFGSDLCTLGYPNGAGLVDAGISKGGYLPDIPTLALRLGGPLAPRLLSGSSAPAYNARV
jgi:hypothetical protein